MDKINGVSDNKNSMILTNHTNDINDMIDI